MLLRILVLAVCCLLAAFGQSNATDAALEGYILDNSGGAVANARCTARNTGTGVETRVASDNSGYFRFPLLAIGSYELIVEAAGFKEYRRSGITLNVGRQARVDVTLELGAVSESVTVTADAALLDSTKQAIEEVVNERAVRALPIVSRNVFNFNLLGPGVKGIPSSGFGTTQFTFGGLNRSTWSADGLDNTQRRFARQIRLVIYTPEAVEEVQVVSGNYSAEFGRAAGGLINIITKSGSNELHGQGLFLYRPNGAAARPALSRTKPDQEWKNLTGTLGGPIKKNRVFFFGQYEWNPLLLPRAVTISPANAQALGLPASELADVPFGEEFHTALGKVSFDLNAKNRGFIRYSRFTNDSPFNGGGGLTIASRSLTFTDRMNGGAGQLTTAFRPNLLNEFRFGINRRYELREQQNNPRPTDAFINITGVANIGNNLGANNSSIETSTQLVDNLTWTKGRHTLKAGLDFQNTSFNQVRGFNRTFVFGGLAASGTRPAVTPLQQYLNTVAGAIDPATGRPYTYTQLQQDLGDPSLAKSFQFWNWFVQDEWRIARRLTLSFGLRYELILYPTLDSQAPFPLSRTIENDANNFAPRFGFSWAPAADGKTVVRGGYGFYYDTPNLGLMLDGAIFNGRRIFSYAIPGTDARAPRFPNLLTAVDPTLALAPNVTAYGRDLRTMYAHMATLQVEREILPTLSLNLQYQFMGSRQGLFSRDINLGAPVGTLLDGRPRFGGAAGRPNSSFRAINLLESGGNTNYNALDVTVRKRFSAGLQFSFTYSWSKALGDAEQGGGALTDPTSRRRDYGIMNADVRHNFVGQALWAPRFSAAGARWINGFEFATMLFSNSGRPIDPRAGVDLNNDLVLNDRPLYLARNSVAGPDYFQWDVRLTRRITFRDRYQVELIAESENFTNRFNAGCSIDGCTAAVVNLATAADFGRVTAVRQNRVFQFGTRFKF
jgi:hypothetical protein